MTTNETVDQRIADLRAAGWHHLGNERWESPGGLCFIGPDEAWAAMRGAAAIANIVTAGDAAVADFFAQKQNQFTVSLRLEMGALREALAAAKAAGVV